MGNKGADRVGNLIPHQIALGVLALLITLLSGCSGELRPPSAETPEGINDNFLSEDLDIDEYVERFEGESREVFVERHAIVEALALATGSQVADIGAGTGFFTALFAEKVGGNGTVYAVEISPKFLEHLRERFAAEEPAPVRVVEGTRNSVELPPSSVDVAFICDVYHHFESPKDSLASLHSAIRPGGSLILIDFDRIPEESPEWIFEHVRAGEEIFRAEIEAAGFAFTEEIQLEGLKNNYMLRFERVE
jgi:SAM-dependent methyltransferase